MFGYLVIHPKTVSKQDRELYRSCYCGLCKCLNDCYGLTGRLTLSYDLTFISMLLSSFYQQEETVEKRVCPIHPIRHIDIRYSEINRYCADMNLLLTYYKQLDDYHDDDSSKAKRKAEKLQPFVSDIQNKWPRQSKMIEECLSAISQMEKDNVMNPDMPSNAFGHLMAEVLSIYDDENKDTLSTFGFHLGKFIYLMDACCDLKKDVRDQKYNPLMMMDPDGFDDMLLAIMEDCCQGYEALNIQKYKAICDNVIYSGVWIAYNLKRKRRKVK